MKINGYTKLPTGNDSYSYYFYELGRNDQGELMWFFTVSASFRFYFNEPAYIFLGELEPGQRLNPIPFKETDLCI